MAVSSREEDGKRLLRQAWEYGQRIDRQTRVCRHPLDLFGTELQGLRKKLREKCLQVILLGASQCIKAEDLLWKKAVYDIVQKCKAASDALDGVSPLYTAYRNHLDLCIDYYSRLLEKLQDKVGMDPYKSTGADFKKGKLEWAKDVYYQCFIHLGDLARYQTAVGENHFTAVVYYHHAIALDPCKGASYNQLAALAGNKNEQLDAAYYYQRSVTSAQPFSGSLSNLHRIYEKNLTRLNTLERELETVTEKDIKEFSRNLLLSRFLRLQQMLQPTDGSISSSTNEKELEKLCTSITGGLEECLAHDLSLLKDRATERVAAALQLPTNQQGQSSVGESLPHDLLLKLCAISILTSHTLRSLGSTFTPSATAFALSIFSQLLEYAHKRLVVLLTRTVELALAGQATPPMEQCIDEGDSMIERLQKVKFDISQVTIPIKDKSGSLSEKPASNEMAVPSRSGAQAKRYSSQQKRVQDKKKLKIVNRRRRRRRGVESDSSEEEGVSADSNSDSEGSLSSDDTLNALSMGEDDLEMFERLSEGSSSEDEHLSENRGQSSPEKSPPKATITQPSSISTGAVSEKRGKRQIVLAANFSLGADHKKPKLEAKEDVKSRQLEDDTPTPVSREQLSLATSDPLVVDDSLRYLMHKTGFQSVVHTACCLAAEESYLMPLRVYMEWLQSCPIAVTAKPQSSSAIWSRLATLLNFLPIEDQLSCLEDTGKVDEHFANFALLEDIALRGFSPVLGYQESLLYGSSLDLSKTKQAVLRIRYFQAFGHFVADLRTVPSFSWDRLGDKFIGPIQKQKLDEKRTREKELEQDRQAQLQRSKLMNAMAQRKLEHDVASLQVSAKQQEVFFTPYLVPNANSLCSGLHIIKKLLASEKFIVVIATATIETLDGMKKGRDNFAAREVIKFLEREFKEGNKFIKAQKADESASPNDKKPAKMDIDTWHLDRLIDCAIHYNQRFSERGQDKAVVTVLLDQKLLTLVKSPDTEGSEQLVQVLQSAWQNGVELDSVIHFHSKWRKKDASH